MYNLIVAGGRDFSNTKLLSVHLKEYLRCNNLDPRDVNILSGMAKGADTIGAQVGKLMGCSVSEYPANWKDCTVENCSVKYGQYGKYNALAGFNRNDEMRKDADGLLAFWDGRSSGTNDMIYRMKQAGKDVQVIKY